MEGDRAAEVAHFDRGTREGRTRSHQRLQRRQAEQPLLVAPQILFAGQEELVELRRLDRRAAQHGVRLAAMMDLVLEEMLQDRGDAAGRRRAVGPRQDQPLGQAFVGLALAEIDQPPVAPALRVIELMGVGEVRRRIVVALQHRRIAMQRVDVVDVDPQDVVQRRAQRREEAGAPLGELGRRQRLAGAEQPVIGPGIVAGHGDEVIDQPRRHGAVAAQAACARLRST